MNILIVNASFRKGSFNGALSAIAEAALKEQGATTSHFAIETLPFMNQDLEADLPEVIKESAEAVKKADAIWVFSPEYNHEMPGVLKNAFDWWSRQKVDNVSILKDKPVTISGIGGGNATKSMQEAFHALMNFLGLSYYEKTFQGRLPLSVWQTGVYSPSEEDKKALEAQAEGFVSFVKGK